MSAYSEGVLAVEDVEVEQGLGVGPPLLLSIEVEDLDLLLLLPPWHHHYTITDCPDYDKEANEG
jgi:hypothetical protein